MTFLVKWHTRRLSKKNGLLSWTEWSITAITTCASCLNRDGKHYWPLYQKIVGNSEAEMDET